ncbi:hypothetical protein LIER_28096 [Lithospermum erythrorhizon]|uniref:Uncharacterized protein n=1 Tax=Lithospermum erythrorhizon TaxID=34254 RepID=A0AAV3RFI4_LITER
MMGMKWFQEVDDLEDPVFSDDDDDNDDDVDQDGDDDEAEDDDDSDGGDVPIDTNATRETRRKIFNEHKARLNEFEHRQKVIEDNQAQLMKGQATVIKDNKKIKKYVKGLMKFLSCFGDANEKTKTSKKFLEHSDDEEEVEATTGEEGITSHPATASTGIWIDDYLIGDDDDDDVMGQFFGSGGGGRKIN